MAFDAFLKLDRLMGESQDGKHKGEIDIVSYRMGLDQGTHSRGSGSGSGKVQIHDMYFTKKADAATPLLLVACATGAHFNQATLVVRKAGGTQLEYLKIVLTGVLVSSFESRGEAERMATRPYTGPTNGGPVLCNGDPVPLEDLSLSFAKIEISYQPQGKDGKADGGPIMASWDLKKNCQ